MGGAAIMKIRTLSASSIATYEGCPARWAAEYNSEDRPQDLSAGFAELGTACHEALQEFVEFMVVWGFDPIPPKSVLLDFYDTAYWKLFQDREKYDDGVEMLTKWHKRQDWTDREVLMTEVKERFPLPIGAGLEIPITYIFDRCDKVTVGDTIEIEVIDYKSFRMPVSAADMKNKIQVRLYALAAAIKFKHLDPNRIWVTYDLLRHDPVSVAFTRDDNRVTWEYLKAVARRILADEEAKEKLNPDCRWCIRRGTCDTLRIHRDAGGILSLLDVDDIGEAVDMRDEINAQQSALKALLGDVDKLLLDHLQHNDLYEIKTANTVLTVGAKGSRSIDAERAATVIGAERVAKRGSLTMGAVDSLLKGDELTIEQKADLKRLITKTFGAPHIKTTAISPTEEED